MKRTDVLDNADTRVRRTRNQRLPAGRILIHDGILLNSPPAAEPAGYVIKVPRRPASLRFKPEFFLDAGATNLD
jgi:hypothetical protein